MRPEVEEAIEYMAELAQDSGVPKSVKAKMIVIIATLKEVKDEELSLTVNKLLADLDEMSGDANLDSFTRQQLWSISSMLEGIDA
jgi:uncharacterized protein (UPF0147 family)